MAAGGAERVASTLANAWVSGGDEVVLMPTFSGRGNCFYELSSKVQLVYLADQVSSHSKSVWGQFLRLRALRKFISDLKPDVIVSFLSNVNVAAVLASCNLKIPLIICERTDPFARPRMIWLRLACAITYPFAEALMVQTQSVAAKYAASYPALRPAFVIPNPAPREQLDIVRHRNGTKGKTLLAIGRLSSEKQFDLLIRVFARLAKRHSDWSLRIVGEGPTKASLQQQICALKLAAQIDLLGSTEKIGDELSNADAFVLTSLFEGFPNVLLEAMASGLPCVTFDCQSGPREISMDGQVALLVAPNDEHALEFELDRLMADADLRRFLGIAARASVLERFALEIVLRKWEALFWAVGCRR